MKTLNQLSKLSEAQTRSVGPENITGEKGAGAMTPLADGTAKHAARDLGFGWKVNPYLKIAPGAKLTLADIQGSGEINHIWMTPTDSWRMQILRIFWDGSDVPAVECPLGDFFACGWGVYSQINSLPVCVNPGSAFNSYWSMPFRKGFRIELENLCESETCIYYQITYELKEVDPLSAYFHAQFRRTNPLPLNEPFVILDSVKGAGSYVGTSLSWGSNNNGWWGEGEIKFYMDGDKEFPTICGTGTEDYFCGSYCFEDPTHSKYLPFSTPYSGFFPAGALNELYASQRRFSMYRWHITDPIHFKQDLRVDIQALGWRSGGRYLPLRDDLAAVAYFYLDKPSCELPKLPTPDELEII
jgi:hypothetical protein